MTNVLHWLSSYSTQLIFICAVVHFSLFVYLSLARKSRLKKMAAQLGEILSVTEVGTSAMAELSDDDLIDSRCQDILGHLKELKELEETGKLEEPGETGELYNKRKNLNTKVKAFDSIKPYKRTHGVEMWYNVARTAIEAYPLLGILGTIIALAVAIGQADPQGSLSSNVVPIHQQSAEISSPQNTQEVMTRIIENFGDAIWSTFAGLGCAVAFMLWNAFVELGFERLTDHRRNIAEVIMWARKVLPPGKIDENT